MCQGCYGCLTYVALRCSLPQVHAVDASDIALLVSIVLQLRQTCSRRVSSVVCRMDVSA